MITINGQQMHETADHKKVMIPKEEYFDLLVCREKLNRLEIGGCDNWDWYGESLYPDGEVGMDLFTERLKKEIFG
jgi:hypothetical protein